MRVNRVIPVEIDAVTFLERQAFSPVQLREAARELSLKNFSVPAVLVRTDPKRPLRDRIDENLEEGATHRALPRSAHRPGNAPTPSSADRGVGSSSADRRNTRW